VGNKLYPRDGTALHMSNNEITVWKVGYMYERPDIYVTVNTKDSIITAVWWDNRR